MAPEATVYDAWIRRVHHSESRKNCGMCEKRIMEHGFQIAETGLNGRRGEGVGEWYEKG